MENKVLIRKKMINLLNNFSADEKKRQTGEILSALIASKTWGNADKIALYMATPMEFDLSRLFEVTDKEILIPKCFPKRQMIFAKYDTEHLVRSNFGLMEPDSMVEVIPDLIVVPGLAWNEQGYRIGFGGGYYDRYLSGFEGSTVSVIYDFQKVDFTPEAHDIAVHEVFTAARKD
ncbi:MAG: 5-formyltetrahydrofolate cyclo-ligase [Streptococcaceae bacterium]|nr:5-formyltetrahydrofolate cyclo-ligase [Streptococcaceae bacterium]